MSTQPIKSIPDAFGTLTYEGDIVAFVSIHGGYRPMIRGVVDSITPKGVTISARSSEGNNEMIPYPNHVIKVNRKKFIKMPKQDQE